MQEASGEPERFRFGENWQSFVGLVDEAAIGAAERGLEKLLPNRELAGRRFLDIGCGSGLSALAALRLGAASVDAIDLDRQSVEAARRLLQRFAPERAWTVRLGSALDLGTSETGAYDIVHSWGVLHHTGDLWGAFDRACAMTAPQGQIAVALYRRTPLCVFWSWEKRHYAAASPATQAAVRAVYETLYRAGLLATGRSPRRYEAAYRGARGMDWQHDVHDWLGGYPYQSTDPNEVASFLAARGFAMERVFEHAPVAFGIFGSHCDEYVAVRAHPRTES